MKTIAVHSTVSAVLATAISLTSAGAVSAAAPADAGVIPVTVENFVRAESDLYFGAIVKDGGFGKFHHNRDVVDVQHQTVVRLNRDTLYSAAVFDLDGGPVTITLPNPGKRFMAMQVINEDHYTPMVIYKPGTHTFTRANVGTRYVAAAIRTLVDPNDPADVKQAHALQDAIRVTQKSPGKFEVPKWDPVSQKKLRDALVTLADTLPNTNRMFGTKDKVDPVRRLIGAASAWGGNPDKDATYLNVFPEKNDGTTVHKIAIRKVPVDGFWSISVYNAKGYYEPNPFGAYTVNSITGKTSADGSITVQFGGCDGKLPNCIPIVAGWNYMVRLYRPHQEILNGSWKFPAAMPVN